jgi:hypothetical protein
MIDDDEVEAVGQARIHGEFKVRGRGHRETQPPEVISDLAGRSNTILDNKKPMIHAFFRQ